LPRTTPPWETTRKPVNKAEDATDPKHGHKPSERPAAEYIRYGLINLDKPAGPTSHEVAAWTKKIMHLTRIGHGGTLEAQGA
jgi:tRNA U55 pseudouridine synthase TruB